MNAWLWSGLLSLATASTGQGINAKAIRELDLAPTVKKEEQLKALFDLYRAKRDHVHAADLAAWRQIDSKEAWEKFRNERIAALKKSLGSEPPSFKPRMHVSRQFDGDGYRVMNVVYESRPDFWVTANAYVPLKPPEGKSPGILIIPSHHNPKTQGELQDMGMSLARQGAMVLVPDQLGHGERRQHPFDSDKAYEKPFKAGRQDYWFRYNSAMQLHVVGESLMGWMANDYSRAIDVLIRMGCDPERIAVLGSVAGGGDPAAVTAAIDPRVKVVAPFNFGGPQPETKFPLPEDAEAAFNYMGGGSWESTRNLIDSGSGGFLPWTICASVAPRGLIHSHEFSWDKDRDPVWKRYVKVWGFYGSPLLAAAHGKGTLQGKYPESTHCNNIGPEHRAMLYPILEKWLKLPLPTPEFSKRLKSDELISMSPELSQKLKPKKLHQVLPSMPIQAKVEPRKVSHERMAPPVKLQESKSGDVKIAKFETTSEGDSLKTPCVLLTPSGEPKKHWPVVVAFAARGAAAFQQHRSDAIAELLKQGVSVCLADLPTTGDIASSLGSGRSSGRTSLSATAMMHGDSLAKLRLRALHRVIEDLERIGLFDDRKISIGLWADSFVGGNAPDAKVEVPMDADPSPRIAEPVEATLPFRNDYPWSKAISAIYVRGGVVSMRSTLESPFVYVPHDLMEPRFLQHGDIDDRTAQLGSMPLRMEMLVDGRNRFVAQGAILTAFPKTQAAYREKQELLHLSAVTAPAAELATWFRDMLRGVK
jgi:dienelactone hydrolase